MSEYTADNIRKVLRVGCCICALIAVIAAIIAAKSSSAAMMYSAYTAARISSMALFGLSALVVIIDLVSKSYSLKYGLIGLAIAAVGFVGSFFIAPACSAQALFDYLLKKADSMGALLTGDVSQIPGIRDAAMNRIRLGRYMVLGGGLVALAYDLKFVKE